MRGSDLESAYLVAYGKWENVDKIEIPYTKTPEDYLLEKDVFRVMSSDARFLCNLVMQLPDELYSMRDTYRVNLTRLFKLCKEQKDWSRTKVNRVLAEIHRKIKRLRDEN